MMVNNYGGLYTKRNNFSNRVVGRKSLKGLTICKIVFKWFILL